MPPDPEDRPDRQTLRIPGFDYASTGSYFVTACTRARAHLFGQVTRNAMHCNAIGDAVVRCWHELPEHYGNVALGAFVVMPNHVHGIISLHRRDRSQGAATLSEVVRGFKSFTAARINRFQGTRGGVIWQRGFYEHVIRTERAAGVIAQYIADNRRQWVWDHENRARLEGPEYAPWMHPGRG